MILIFKNLYEVIANAKIGKKATRNPFFICFFAAHICFLTI
jgi:hypothetical protein